MGRVLIEVLSGLCEYRKSISKFDYNKINAEREARVGGDLTQVPKKDD
jgi:hypothetical protein